MTQMIDLPTAYSYLSDLTDHLCCPAQTIEELQAPEELRQIRSVQLRVNLHKITTKDYMQVIIEEFDIASQCHIQPK